MMVRSFVGKQQEYKFLPSEIEEAANKVTFELLLSMSKQ